MWRGKSEIIEEEIREGNAELTGREVVRGSARDTEGKCEGMCR
jgi:hypothetical protein